MKNRVAILTGAASGIGRATATDLAQRGCTLVLVDIKEDEVREALDEVRAHAPSSSAEACDITDRARVGEVVRAAVERHGRIDILVNIAGMMTVKLFAELSDDEVRRMMDVNYYGALHFIREVVPVMERQGKGVIINAASVGGKLIVPGTSAYAASKAAIYAFSEGLHLDLKDRGIHVGVIVPGGIATGIFDNVGNRLGEYYRDHCTTSPRRITRSIAQAIEKERFETVVPFSANFLLAARGLFPTLLRRSLLSRMRPYMD